MEVRPLELGWNISVSGASNEVAWPSLVRSTAFVDVSLSSDVWCLSRTTTLICSMNSAANSFCATVMNRSIRYRPACRSSCGGRAHGAAAARDMPDTRFISVTCPVDLRRTEHVEGMLCRLYRKGALTK